MGKPGVRVRRLLKRVAQGIALAIVFPLAAAAGFGRFYQPYLLFGQAIALFPGLAGSYIRAAFYRLTLRECSQETTIWFGTYFSDREARVDRNISIGSFCIIGRATIGEGTQISSNVQITSGRHEHRHDAEGRLLEGKPDEVSIGSHCWIGASATIMASVGARSIIGAGAVVVKSIQPDAVAVGNPARVIKTTENAQRQ